MQTPQNGYSAKVLCDQRKRSEKGILSDSIYIKVSKRQNEKDGNQVSGCQNLREGGYWLQKTPDIFFLILFTFYIPILVLVTLLHAFAKILQTIYLRRVIFKNVSHISIHLKIKLKVVVSNKDVKNSCGGYSDIPLFPFLKELHC